MRRALARPGNGRSPGGPRLRQGTGTLLDYIGNTRTAPARRQNRAFAPFPDRTASLLPGPLAATRTGLPPAGDDELTNSKIRCYVTASPPALLGARMIRASASSSAGSAPFTRQRHEAISGHRPAIISQAPRQAFGSKPVVGSSRNSTTGLPARASARSSRATAPRTGSVKVCKRSLSRGPNRLTVRSDPFRVSRYVTILFVLSAFAGRAGRPRWRLDGLLAASPEMRGRLAGRALFACRAYWPGDGTGGTRAEPRPQVPPGNRMIMA
jgi:hypothetical protein